MQTQHRIQVTIFYVTPNAEYYEDVVTVIGTIETLRTAMRNFKAGLPEGTRILHTKLKANEIALTLN